jgi:hypothetical protein
MTSLNLIFKYDHKFFNNPLITRQKLYTFLLKLGMFVTYL